MIRIGCTARFSSAGTSHTWSIDSLLPAFMFVVVRSQLQHLGAEIRLVADFCPQVRCNGEIAMMFTMLQSAYIQICKEKSNP
ncbi:unnamed protein product [Bursaphelenchus okinawaensis]|uniref:VPS9 domain-containing protein n=1 Tax=Bursaphelenchus okinawaensis TaxID=465554 RepID=A0A811L7Y6_9BILA|nr:unnamed protein product [Bursaphelenchus okinawaensis]CAG9117804.1 unnamed protein product [Bursaphelenchus okinawaensis]